MLQARCVPTGSAWPPLSSIGEGAANWLRCALAVGVFFGVDALSAAVLRAAGIRFPSSVAGMLLCFFAMLLLRATTPELAQRIAALVAPGARFLGRWMALFFVPPLVLLPLTPLPSSGDLVRMALLLGLGLVSVLLATAWVARSMGAPQIDTTARLVAPDGWSARTVIASWAAFAALGWGLSAGAPGAASSLPGVVLGLSLSVLGFVFGEQLRLRLQATRWALLANVVHPVLLSALGTCLTWLALGYRLPHYLGPADAPYAGNWLMAFLGPSVVALGMSLDAQRTVLRQGATPLFASTLLAAGFSLFATALLARVLGLPPHLARAFVPRSVTTPIALSIAELLHADRGLTAALVITTGVLGALFALPLLRRAGFHSSFVLGIATGAASHGIGTAALVREEPAAAALAGISFALTATASVLLVSMPPLRALLLWIVG